MFQDITDEKTIYQRFSCHQYTSQGWYHYSKYHEKNIIVTVEEKQDEKSWHFICSLIITMKMFCKRGIWDWHDNKISINWLMIDSDQRVLHEIWIINGALLQEIQWMSFLEEPVSMRKDESSLHIMWIFSNANQIQLTSRGRKEVGYTINISVQKKGLLWIINWYLIMRHDSLKIECLFSKYKTWCTWETRKLPASVSDHLWCAVCLTYHVLIEN